MGTDSRVDPAILSAGLCLGLMELFCLAPTVHIHDAGELTAAAWTLGLGHPPGSPLYMLLAKIFMTLLPFGHIAWRANFFSAIFSVGTFFLLSFWARRRGLSSSESILVGALAVLAPTLWSQALMAEVYTLQAFLLAAVLIGLDLEFRPEMIALLWGLLLSCHISLAPLSPLFLLLLSLPARGFREAARRIIGLGFLMAIPLLLYAYVPIRALASPPVDWSHPHSLSDIWDYLSNANVRARSFSLSAGEYALRSGDFLRILLWNLHLGIPLLILGSTLKGRRKTILLSWLIIIADFGFVVLLDTAPLGSEAYGIASIIAAAILAGLGLEKLRKKVVLRRILIGACSVSIILVLYFGPWPFNLSSSFLVRDTVEAVLSQTPCGAILMTQEDNTTFPLAYLVAVEGARPDLIIYDRAGNLFRSPWDRPLYRVRGRLPEYRRSLEEGMVRNFLNQGKKVVFTAPFLEYEPVSWILHASGTVGLASLPDDSQLPETPEFPAPRAPKNPGWMSRQILAMDHIRRAASDQGQGRRDRAVIHLEEADRLSNLVTIDIQIAQLALKTGSIRLAGRAAGRAMNTRPRMAPAWQLGAHIALLDGRLEEAETLNEQALYLDPSLPQAQLTAGMIALRHQDWQRAESHFTTAIEKGLGGDLALIDRALTRERLGDLPGALDDLRKASERHPSGNAALLRLRLVARNGFPPQEILEALCSLTRLRPATDFEASELGEILLISARAGAPDCVRDWVQPFLASARPEKEIVAAYLRGTGERGAE